MIDKLLHDRRVLVTRPTLQADELVAAIEASGGEAVRFPVMRIVARDRNEVAADFAASPSPDIAIFVSRNAVEHGWFAVRGCGARIAAVGPTTAAAIDAQNCAVDIAPDSGWDSEHLLADPALEDVSGLDVTIVRGQHGREHLGDTLIERGARVTYLPVYERQINRIPQIECDRLSEDWAEGRIDCVTVLSVESLRFLLELLPDDATKRLASTPLVAPGRRVIQTACELVSGIPATMASGPRAADIVDAVIESLQSGKGR
jgi:uroporphyrinogen-III synthase